MFTVFDPVLRRMVPGPADPLDRSGPLTPPDAQQPPPPLEPTPTEPPRSPWPRRRRWIKRGALALMAAFMLLVGYLAFTAPLSKSLQPPVPPSITLLSAEGTPIARRGAIIAAPVDAAKLPHHVTEAFLAIEDRRFYSHWGIDPRGIARAAWSNLWAGGVREGGSTITQQLAKNAFLNADRTATRKLREVVIAFWLEAWLSKNEILSRYLSSVYFGDNIFGLRAAARHYFGREPEDLSVGQAAMLAGLVKAPSKLAPTHNLAGARARQKLVVAAMADAGMLDKDEAAHVRPARIVPDRVNSLPNGTYFADWVLPQARDRTSEDAIPTEQTVRTTLETRLQRAAERAIRGAGLRTAQAAMVVMHPDGRVVAMVGGKNYTESPFNRATQARRQPGSTFKLFVYLAALRAGMTPDSSVEDEPITIAGWSPKNVDGHYRGTITLREAFARSSNVAAARLANQVGPRAVIRAARDLGITTPIPEEASIALGTSGVSLIELTSAYAAVANGANAVQPHGLTETPQSQGWLSALGGKRAVLGRAEVTGLRDLLANAVHNGTGHGAELPIDAYGKTGTTQDKRDVLFIGFAGDLVAGVWVGNDDNTPNPGLTSSIPARIWRNFMIEALGIDMPAPPEEEMDQEPEMNLDDMINGLTNLDVDVSDQGLNARLPGRGALRIDRDGVEMTGPDGRPLRGRGWRPEDRQREVAPDEDAPE